MIRNDFLSTFRTMDLSDMTLPMIVVYYRPSDLPGSIYIARLFVNMKATGYITAGDTLEQIRGTIPEHMVCVQREENDEPVIQEVWL